MYAVTPQLIKQPTKKKPSKTAVEKDIQAM